MLQTNGIIEREAQDMLIEARTLLVVAGMPRLRWSYAAPCFRAHCVEQALWGGSVAALVLEVPEREVPKVEKQELLFPQGVFFGGLAGPVTNIFAGAECTFVTAVDGSAYGCGLNGDGQVGLGFASMASRPLARRGPTRVCGPRRRQGADLGPGGGEWPRPLPGLCGSLRAAPRGPPAEGPTAAMRGPPKPCVHGGRRHLGLGLRPDAPARQPPEGLHKPTGQGR